jgi:hypothetical protein
MAARRRLCAALLALVTVPLALSGTAEAATVTAPSTAFAYTGTWADGANGEKASTELGATAKLVVDTAADGRVGISGLKTPWSGKASVQVDAKAPTTESLYRAGGSATVEWYVSPLLTAGRHTITVKVLHTKAVDSADYWVSVISARIVSGTVAGTEPAPTPTPTPSPLPAPTPDPDSRAHARADADSTRPLLRR